MGSRENVVCASCMRVLSLRGIPAFRINSGACRVGKRFIRFGAPGLPDIIGVLPDGRFLGVETKAPAIKGLFGSKRAGKRSPQQIAAHRAANAAGAEQNQCVVYLLDQQVVDADFAELVDQHCRASHLRLP